MCILPQKSLLVGAVGHCNKDAQIRVFQKDLN